MSTPSTPLSFFHSWPLKVSCTNITKQVSRYYPTALVEPLQFLGDAHQGRGHNGDFKVGEKQASAKPAEIPLARAFGIELTRTLP